VLRSVTPPVTALCGRTVRDIQRIGKQIVFSFDDDLFLIIHLMIAGRFQWKGKNAAIPARLGLAAFDFATGTLLLTEAASKKRASLHVVKGKEALAEFDRGGLEVLSSNLEEFREPLTRENHTLKRSLTDPRLFSGIGNAYSDEILHRARLSPLKLTSKLTDDEIRRLHDAVKTTLSEWADRLRSQAGDDFPSKVTAFRPEMAVHGRYGKPCPECGSPVQRIVYAENECNYCATCQTGGRLLADRAMSRLLKEDWPRSLDEWEAHVESRR
jgi:formamidopyrimidine-DNA glycosylase